MVKKIFRQKVQYFYENCSLAPLDMYSALSKVYYISNQKEEIHYKGLTKNDPLDEYSVRLEIEGSLVLDSLEVLVCVLE